MAVFQQFIEGGATDRSGSAGQADRMRASAEAQAGSMIADSTRMQAEGTSRFIQESADIVTTGATQYATQEYQTGETAVDVDGITLNLNIQKIEEAHRTGKLSTEQANIAKRKLGVKVLKHNPLADPQQVSASVFRQKDFQKTDAEKLADKRRERDAKFEDDVLHKSGLYRTDFSPEERAVALEAAIRENNITQNLEQIKKRVGLQNEVYAGEARKYFVSGTGSADFYKGLDAHRTNLKKTLLSISNMNASASDKRIMIDTAVADTVANLQKGNSLMLSFPEGKTALDSGVSVLQNTAKGYTDKVLTGKLDAETMQSTRDAYKAKLDHEFNMKFGNSQRVLNLSKTLAEISYTNPSLYVEVESMAKNLSSGVVENIHNKNVDYNGLRIIDTSDTPNASVALFTLPQGTYEKGSDEELAYFNTLGSQLKSWAREGEAEGVSGKVPAKAYTKVPESVSTKAKFDTLSPNAKEGYKDFYNNAAFNDFLPNSFNSIQKEVASKGVDTSTLSENVAMTTNNFKVVFTPRNDSPEAKRASDLLNQSSKTRAVNNFLITTPHVLGINEQDLVARLNQTGNPALFNIEPTVTEQVGQAVGTVGRVGVATAQALTPGTQLLKALEEGTPQETGNFIADIVNPIRGITGNRSKLATKLDELEAQLKEEFMKGFEGDE